MKIVSVLFFSLALVGTWVAVHAVPPVGQTMHQGIQQDLKRSIMEYVQAQVPQAQDLKFSKFWTETVKKNKVKASFRYSFADAGQNGEPVVIEINGWALLDKIEESGDTTTWSLYELHVSDNRVDFQEPIEIKASSEPASE